MNSIEKIIFPSFVAGSIFIFFISGILTDPGIALASSGENAGAMEPADQKNSNFWDIFSTTNPADSIPLQDTKDCVLAAAVPEEIRIYCREILDSAAETGLDPDLIAAIILQESGGNPAAYSDSGAVGLMQVMPRDGLAAEFMCINGPCFSERPSIEELNDPEFNIHYGSRLLHGLLQKYGSIREALMAYGPANAGYTYADIVLSIYQDYQ